MSKKRSAGNRVWIELELHPDIAIAKARAEKATAILRKLGDGISKFWFNERDGRYCISFDSAGSYLVCTDNGHWFDLDFMSK